jgi:hypothetical protein
LSIEIDKAIFFTNKFGRLDVMKIVYSWIMVGLLGLVLFSPFTYNAYVWHQIEKQALIADLVEGMQV